MGKEKWQEGIAPLGLYFSFLTKYFMGAMVQKLPGIDLDKYFRVLIVVEQSKETFTQQNLSDYFKMNKASMVRIIDYLTKKGYLRRKVNKKDRRAYFLMLTKKAKSELPAMQKAISELEEIALKDFSAEQKSLFFESLEKIYMNMATLPVEDIFLNYEKMEPEVARKDELQLAVVNKV